MQATNGHQVTITAAPTTPPRSGYIDIEHIKDVDGILGIISKRVNGAPIHSVAIFKTFKGQGFARDGVEDKSNFWSWDQADSVQRVLAIVVPRARELEEAAMAEHTRQHKPSR